MRAPHSLIVSKFLCLAHAPRTTESRSLRLKLLHASSRYLINEEKKREERQGMEQFMSSTSCNLHLNPLGSGYLNLRLREKRGLRSFDLGLWGPIKKLSQSVYITGLLSSADYV